MQNEPNFQKSQMNVNLYNTTDYENKSNWTLGENEPNTNPIKANFPAPRGETNPIQTQYKPNQTQFQTRMTNVEVQMRVKIGRKIADFRPKERISGMKPPANTDKNRLIVFD